MKKDVVHNTQRHLNQLKAQSHLYLPTASQRQPLTRMLVHVISRSSSIIGTQSHLTFDFKLLLLLLQKKTT